VGADLARARAHQDRVEFPSVQAILQELLYDSLREGAVWPFDDHYIRPPHFHGQLECLIVTRGTAWLHLGGERVRARAGQLCWILPGVPHVMSEFSDDFDMWVVQFDPAVVAACWRPLDRNATRPASASLFDHWPVFLGERLAGRAAVEVGESEVARLAQQAAQVWGGHSRDQAGATLRALCARALAVTLANLDHRRAASVSQLASCLLLASPSLDRPSLAAELGVSEGFLSRRFHRELGVTLLEHRARTRIAHFLALAQGARCNLLDAALGAGFGSYSQFHRTFTRVAGAAPRAYLRGGRQRVELLVAGDRARPHAAPLHALQEHQRQAAPIHG
jgi:AraC-like DNA-binding protein